MYHRIEVTAATPPEHDPYNTTVPPPCPSRFPGTCAFFYALVPFVAGAMLTVRWPDVGCRQPVSLYSRNSPGYFFACRVLAVEFNRHDRLLNVHFDVRGESDLVPPSSAWLSLGTANSTTRYWERAIAMPLKLQQLKSGRHCFVTAHGLTTSVPSTRWRSRWPDSERGGQAWAAERGNWYRSHVTFKVKTLDAKLREPAAGLLGSEGVKPKLLQLNFYYARRPDYNQATLAEWSSAKHVSMSEALSTYSSGDGELSMLAPGEMSAKVAVSEEDTVEYAKKKSFAFAPDEVKSRAQWWG